MKTIWRAVIHWFEYGDLVPLLVLVSAVHYSVVLADVDAWPVAIAIGILVDLGHYRLVRAAVRYAGANQRERVARWSFVLAMTAVSLAYHQRYYNDWWLSAPLPFLIVTLAWLQRVDRATGQRTAPLVVAQSETPAEPADEVFVCGACGRSFASKNALNGHRRAHSKNGKVVTKSVTG